MNVYRAVINLDFTKPKANAYQKIITALLQLGWQRIETSALVIETEDINRIWVGGQVVAKGAGEAGILSSYTLQVQLINRPRKYAAAKNHPHALEQILALKDPSVSID